jgi:predicted kinase
MYNMSVVIVSKKIVNKGVTPESIDATAVYNEYISRASEASNSIPTSEASNNTPTSEASNSTPTPQASNSIPNIILLCGPSGSGKSTIANIITDEEPSVKYITIDADEIRTELGDIIKLNDYRDVSSIVNQLIEKIVNDLISKKTNIIFDTTGRNYGQMLGIINTAKKSEYKIVFVAVWASKETCLKRVKIRNAHLLETESSRIQLQENDAAQIYDGFKPEKPNKDGILPKGILQLYLNTNLRLEFDEIRLYNNDTDKSKPILVYPYKDETTIIKDDFKFYDIDVMQINLPPPTTSTVGGKTRKKHSMKKGTKIRRRSPNGKIERNKQITKKETTKKKKHVRWKTKLITV